MDKKYNPEEISSRTVGRLTQYLSILNDLLKTKNEVNSIELANKMKTTAAQVRKDLSTFGEFGVRGKGYHIKTLIEIIESILGIDKENEIIVVGYGKVGAMIASNTTVLGKGFKLVGVFDKNKDKISENISELNIKVQSIDKIKSFVKKHNIETAVLAVNSEFAQESANKLVEAGVKAILNMTVSKLELSDEIAVVNVNISARLQELNFWRTHPVNPKGGIGLG